MDFVRAARRWDGELKKLAVLHGCEELPLYTRSNAKAGEDALVKALQFVADWKLPETGEYWPSGAMVSYEAAYVWLAGRASVHAAGRQERPIRPARRGELMRHEISDAEILAVLRQRSSEITYVIRNILSPGRPHLETAQIRCALVRMEKAGIVKRVPATYATQIRWALVAPDQHGEVPS